MTSSLKGQFLVSTPGMGDPRFTESVIYVVSHGDDGAMGLVVNQPMPDIQFAQVLAELDLGPSDDIVNLPSQVRDRPVLRGGPVETSRGFVLHSADFGETDAGTVLNDDICLTASLDMLRAISFGPSPRDALFALGYCGWAAGQLESELQRDGWLMVPYARALMFDAPLDARYKEALGILGVTHASLSPVIGNA